MDSTAQPPTAADASDRRDPPPSKSQTDTKDPPPPKDQKVQPDRDDRAPPESSEDGDDPVEWFRKGKSNKPMSGTGPPPRPGKVEGNQ